MTAYEIGLIFHTVYYGIYYGILRSPLREHMFQNSADAYFCNKSKVKSTFWNTWRYTYIAYTFIALDVSFKLITVAVDFK